MMDGQTSVAPVLMRFQRGCQQVRDLLLDCVIFEILCSSNPRITIACLVDLLFIISCILWMGCVLCLYIKLIAH